MAANSKPTVEVTQDGDRFSIKLHSMFITREENFTVGEPYEQNQHDGSISNVSIYVIFIVIVPHLCHFVAANGLGFGLESKLP